MLQIKDGDILILGYPDAGIRPHLLARLKQGGARQATGWKIMRINDCQAGNRQAGRQTDSQTIDRQADTWVARQQTAGSRQPVRQTGIRQAGGQTDSQATARQADKRTARQQKIRRIARQPGNRQAGRQIDTQATDNR